MASLDAGTSSGSEYQVFLSFRGPDTREGFTDVLYHCLTDAGIRVFRDDEELRIGKKIDGSLRQAIDNSRIYIPVFSRNYASSQSCLCELAQIVANTSQSKGNKEILPIFFDVKPDDVKLKTPLYRDAILNLEHKKKLSNEQIDVWREALMEVDAIKGWEVKKYKGYGELIKLVVEEVVKELKTKHRKVTQHLVGINERVGAVSKLLDVNSGDAQLIIIYGMGGIGKTTLAKVVFNRLSSHFGKYCCFLEDVRAKSSLDDDLVKLQKKLLSEIGHPVGTRSIDNSDDGMKRIEEVLHNKKVLIVLDDVDNSRQVEKLVGERTLHSGSRILITTRIKDVLRIHKPKYQISYYEMEMMSIDCALELFSWHAFKSDSPSDDYDDLSRQIVCDTGRLPLALEVIGSFLYDKRQQIWQETLEKLTKEPHKDVFGKLKISYDALTSEQQQIYLDIACFFIGEDKTNPIYMWKDCEFSVETGVDVLINMSLVKIVDNDKFWMHDQLRDLGREIVRQENLMNPRKRSRLWICEEILDIMTTKEIKRKVLAMDIDLRKSYLKNVIESEEIERFESLKYLKLNWGTFAGKLENGLTELRWIVWSNPLPTSKPTPMHLKNVVILEFSDINVIDDSTLQNLIKMARKLKVLSLTRCASIIRILDFSGCPKLERLTLDDCSNLRKIDSSIGKLNFLTHLIIYSCHCLQELPEEIGNLVNLKHFSIQSCGVKKLPDSIWKLKSLCKVIFFNYFGKLDSQNTWELPSCIVRLQKLEELHLKNDHLKGPLPSEIGSLPFLKILNLAFTHVTEVPKTISMLPRLQRLELVECHRIQELPALPLSLTHLEVSSKSLHVVPDLSKLTNLIELDLSDCGGGHKPCTGGLWWIGRLSKLTKLSLNLQGVPAPGPIELASLSLLKELDLSGLNLQTFTQLPLSLQMLGLDNFNSILSLSPYLKNLSCLRLHGFPMQEFQLDGLQLPNITNLYVGHGKPLERFRLLSMRKLKEVHVFNCPKLVDIHFSWFESLESLSLRHCESIKRLVNVGEAGHDDNSESVYEFISCEGRVILHARAFTKFHSFIMENCQKKIHEIQVVGSSDSWEIFRLHGCASLQSLGGLSNFRNLRSLRIKDSNRLRVVEGLNELERLDELMIDGCESSERLIDTSSTKLPNHCHIHIHDRRKDFRGFLESYKHNKESCFDWIWSCFGAL